MILYPYMKKHPKLAQSKIRLVLLLSGLIMAIWITATVVIPAFIGNGTGQYTGLQKKMAETLVDLTGLYHGPQSPSFIPGSAYYVHIDEIRPVTEQERQTCKDHDYISTSDSDPHYYTAIVTEGYLGLLKHQTTYIGCDPTDYIYVQVFGYPKGKDPRVKINP